MTAPRPLDRWLLSRWNARRLPRYELEPGRPLCSDGRVAQRGGGKTASPRAWSWAALMHRAFGIDVLACAQCGGHLRLIATLHDPAVIRKILAHLPLCHSGQSPGCAFAASMSQRIDGIGVGGIACRSPGRLARPARRLQMCAVAAGSWGGRCLSLADYVMGTGTTRGATAAGGASVDYPHLCVI